MQTERRAYMIHILYMLCRGAADLSRARNRLAMHGKLSEGFRKPLLENLVSLGNLEVTQMTVKYNIQEDEYKLFGRSQGAGNVVRA